ncbi:MAG: DUF4160 domain-containing protein [Deltaproteobacteria bacterium]|nr:DUF4160 domain-containing protein [Deltaproteobacteria bacterium]
MPNLLRVDGWRYFFYSNEGDPREPPHVHARKGASEAKFWLEPELALAYSDAMDPRSLREVAAVVQQHRTAFIRSWHEYFAN